MCGGKFAFKIRLGQPYSWKEIYRFSLFYFVFEGNFQVQAPQGAYISRGDLTEGVLRHKFGELNIFGGAYTWRSLFSEFYGMLQLIDNLKNRVSTDQCYKNQSRIQTFREGAGLGRGEDSVIQTLRKGGSVSDKTFSALRTSVWSKIKGGPGPPGPSP